MGPVLVVGASGVLAPTASALVARGVTVTGIARQHPMPVGVEALHVDASDAEALHAVIGARRWFAAVVYAPAASPKALSVIGAAVERLVLVRTVAAVAPELGVPTVAPDMLQLGWTGGEGSERWHTADEIAAAALDVLDTGRARTLGDIRPWERRP